MKEKNMVKKILKYKLKKYAKQIIEKYNPEVVAITGSVGKTTTKELVYAVLKSKYNVRRSQKNYNNEIGVPLTIIGADSPGSSINGWLKIFKQAHDLLSKTDNNYPKILVLEMGVDRPGDMEYLMDIVKPDTGVVTTIGQSHLEYFGTEAKIQKEKGVLIENVKKEGWTILNYDNEKTKQLADRSKAKVLTFGIEKGGDVGARDCTFKDGGVDGKYGVNFKLRYDGSFMPMLLPGVMSKDMVYAAIAAASVGIAHGMNLVEISNALREAQLPPGRMNILKGIKNAILIDDTYNASPQSSTAAVESIKNIPSFAKKRKIAVLGDMLELGTYSDKGHKQVGESLVDAGFDILIAVGEQSKKTINAAIKKGFKEENITHFSNSVEAAEYIKDKIGENDIIVIKGSRGMKMERVVEAVITN